MAHLLLDQDDVGTLTVESLAKLINAQESINVSGQIQINNLKIDNVDLKIENVDLSNHTEQATEIYIADDKNTIEINMANEAVANCQSLMQPDPLNELQCQKCGKQFADINNLKSHELTHEEESLVECKYLCTVCGEKFDKSNALSAHLVVHRDLKLHPCEVCDLVFSDEESLKEHALTHGSQKLYCCQK